jgi:hypothetical protein
MLTSDEKDFLGKIPADKIVKILPYNPDEYRKLKESMNGKSFKEYQEKKYEFYHKILNPL